MNNYSNHYIRKISQTLSWAIADHIIFLSFPSFRASCNVILVFYHRKWKKEKKKKKKKKKKKRIWNITDHTSSWSDLGQQKIFVFPVTQETSLLRCSFDLAHVSCEICKITFFSCFFSYSRDVVCCWFHFDVWRS